MKYKNVMLSAAEASHVLATSAREIPRSTRNDVAIVCPVLPLQNFTFHNFTTRLMTIRNRLTWLFVGVVAVILLGVMTTIYLLQADYTHEEFHQLLRDRAEVTGYVILEQDELRAEA